MLDWHSCQICYTLEIKILLLLLLWRKYRSPHTWEEQEETTTILNDKERTIGSQWSRI